MAHDMFNIAAQVQKYPLFDKVLEDSFAGIEGALYWTIGESGLRGLPKKIITIVEKGIDGTDAEKEAIMVGTLARIAPFFSKTALSAECEKVLEQMSAYDTSTVAPEKVAQVEAVTNSVLQAAMLPMFRESGMRVGPTQIAETNKAMTAQEKLFLPNLNAPRLEAIYMKTKKAALDAMMGRTAAPKTPKAP